MKTKENSMNDLLKQRESLKLSEEQLRTELDWNRAQNYSKCTRVPQEDLYYWITSLNDRRPIREVVMLLSPRLDSHIWSNFLETHVWFGFFGQRGSSISMILNIILCALFGRITYQDLDSTWHIPIYCIEQPYSHVCIAREIPVHHIEWLESSSSSTEPKERIEPLCLHESEFFLLHDGHYSADIIHNRYIMFMISFSEPTLLEKVVLHWHEWNMVFQEDRICSIDFMEYKLYVIILDPQIQDLVHLGNTLDQHLNHREVSQSLGLVIPNNLQIDLETHPYHHSISLIKALSLN